MRFKGLIEIEDTSIFGRIPAFFPLVFGFVFLAHGIGEESYGLLSLSLLLIIAGFWTLFAKGKTLYDDVTKELCRYRKWMWFEWERRTPVNDFECVNVIVLSDGGHSHKTYSYCVNLRSKTSPLPLLHLHDLRLQVFSWDEKDKAIKHGRELAQVLGLEFEPPEF